MLCERCICLDRKLHKRRAGRHRQRVHGHWMTAKSMGKHWKGREGPLVETAKRNSSFKVKTIQCWHNGVGKQKKEKKTGDRKQQEEKAKHVDSFFIVANRCGEPAREGTPTRSRTKKKKGERNGKWFSDPCPTQMTAASPSGSMQQGGHV